MSRHSYRDLHITTADMERTSISNLPYNVQVLCIRSGGWEVWHRPDDQGELVQLAGEYGANELRLDVAGCVICDSINTPEEIDP